MAEEDNIDDSKNKNIKKSENEIVKISVKLKV